ncbi:MAG: AMP-binding protein [Opitutaceae bacterium]|nr:AMP-binding protein [Opitutaceae bacterium]
MWKSRMDVASSSVDSLIANGGSERIRIALSVSDPESFCAWFLALGRYDIDLFCFNPKWGEQEHSVAMDIARPHWVLGDFSDVGFEHTAGVEAKRGVDNIAVGLRLMIPTGGTSGKIRFTMHRWSSLSASVYGFQVFFNVNHVSSFCVLPLYHVSGFMQLIRALLTMGKVVFGSVDTFKEGHSVLADAKERGCFLSLVATQLERLLRDEANVALLRGYRAIFVGGGPVPDSLLKKGIDLELPLAPTYGMSETAAQVATMEPDAFLEGRTGQGKALPHARLSVVDDEGSLLKAGEVGRIQIAASSIFRGYYGEEERLVDSIVAPDLGSLDDFGNLTVIGRSDRVIISGGEKIDLHEIERVLEETRLVSDVFAFGLEDSEWGSKLVLAYVPVAESTVDEELRVALRGKLSDLKMPKIWLRMKSLPRNEAGKIQTEVLFKRIEKSADRWVGPC